MKSINRDITKQYILEKLDQVDIFSHYLEVDERDIIACIKYNILMVSPLRNTDSATVGFKYTSAGILRMRDFAGYFWGDCFDLVGYVLNKNVKNGYDFVEILTHIAIQLGVIDDDGRAKAIEKRKVSSRLIEIKKEKKIIEISDRRINKLDLEYWNKYIYDENFTIKYLKYFNIYMVKTYWIDRHINPVHKYDYNYNDPCYAYYGLTDSDGIDNIKLYFPNRKKPNPYPKFITNASFIFGIHHLVNLKTIDFLIITKSTKDVVSLYSYTNKYNPKIGIVSLSSESTPLNKEQFDWLSSFVTKKIKNTDHKAVFTLLDFDLTGIRMSNRLRKEFNTYPFFITNGRFGTVDYNEKDFTDLTDTYNKDQIDNLISVSINNINRIII